ncbi:hypothetical protein Dd703_0638 [Musicola paradisiaca Ech703]|uniref:Uncharacterized protein n=1 Tax=Musicola paradisiaca (strain Ech703) TaxID=579405 RepID=C6C9J8_MUSP7|nr:hypothetical protein Dd703_0638 [Musicola paradisiaca Ech703]
MSRSGGENRIFREIFFTAIYCEFKQYLGGIVSKFVDYVSIMDI